MTLRYQDRFYINLIPAVTARHFHAVVVQAS